MERINNQNRLSGQYDMVVFSHLRWEFVTQRPQHLINRISKGRKVLFVEEPIGFDESNNGTANVIYPTENITVIQPHIDYKNNIREVSQIVNKFIKRLGIKNPILWFYFAHFYPIAKNIRHSLVVYDCMDELSAFKNPLPTLISDERKLLEEADIVFTGGKSIYEAKSKIAKNTYCFPSSVDRKHFEKALDPKTTIPADIKNLKRPIVGYYGVIDERVDQKLLFEISQKMPEVTFLMIGPVVKIDEDELPKGPNIVYVGGKEYEELPNYLKEIDICMMPFAMNESTKFISPTKTLEYMVAHKPIISTPVYDVVRDYSNEVKIVEDAKEFVAAVNYFLNEPEIAKQQRERLQTRVIEQTSWDNTALQMSQLINKALEKPHVPSFRLSTINRRVKIEA
jgi:glycosyltransferase involved in cell wall biosynthesis